MEAYSPLKQSLTLRKAVYIVIQHLQHQCNGDGKVLSVLITFLLSVCVLSLPSELRYWQAAREGSQETSLGALV